MKLKKNLLTARLAALALSLSISAYAQTQIVGGVSLGDSNSYEVLLGVTDSETSDGMFYGSYYNSGKGVNLEDIDIGGSYSSMRLGIKHSSFDKNAEIP